MPRKTKETDNKKEDIKSKVAELKEKRVPKKTVVKETSEVKEKKTTTTKKAPTKKATTSATAKKTATKKTTTPATAKKTVAKKATTPATTKKTASKKATTKKSTSSSKKTSTTKTTAKPKLKQYSPEYYDLPYRYNKTVVKILAQTPTNLFVYWEISDEDRENLKNTYGQYFFEITKPVLVIHNETMGYSFEVDINDFANSWYIQVNDSDCEYKVELGRRPIPINYSYMPQYNVKKDGPITPVEKPYIYISSSNNLEFPNDHILFNMQNKVYFRNVKTNQVIEKDISDFPFTLKNNDFVNIYEIYEKLFKEEISNGNILRRNPSSGGNPSSGSFSSKFK